MEYVKVPLSPESSSSAFTRRKMLPTAKLSGIEISYDGKENCGVLSFTSVTVSLTVAAPLKPPPSTAKTNNSYDDLLSLSRLSTAEISPVLLLITKKGVKLS